MFLKLMKDVCLMMPEKVENVEANDVATERSSKRMRVRTQESALYISDLFFFPSRFFHNFYYWDSFLFSADFVKKRNLE